MTELLQTLVKEYGIPLNLDFPEFEPYLLHFRWQPVVLSLIILN